MFARTLIVVSAVAALLPLAATADAANFAESLPALHAAPDPSDRGRIVDARGREVLLRGVNVNVLTEQWQGSGFPTAPPFGPNDIQRMQRAGWSLVRLQLSWSRIEPRPGVYDEAYLSRVAGFVELFRRAGLYTILDVHQDAWGASLATRPGEICPEGLAPAQGWSGAPAWATLVPDLVPRCFPLAMNAAWAAFWRDDLGPGGVGIRTRYVSMLGYVARRLATSKGLAGYDVLNDPAPTAPAVLTGFYRAALDVIRGAERVAGAQPRLVLLQRPTATGDGDVVFAPHVYGATRATFQAARDEARSLGGAPVLVGEWGYDPRNPPEFAPHQELQDTFAVGSALWTWRQSCGDPSVVLGRAPWGLYDVDCSTNETTGLRKSLLRRLTRPYVRAAPGRLHGQRYVSRTGRFSAVGEAPEGNRATLLVFYPGSKHPRAHFRATGIAHLRAIATPDGGRLVLGVPSGPWTLQIGPGLG